MNYHLLRKTSPIWRDGARARNEVIGSLVETAIGGQAFRLLDVATADGRTIEVLRDRFPRGQFVGLDPNESFLRVAASGKLAVVRGEGQRLPFSADTFDVAVISATLKHFRRYELFLTECRRVLRPGGFFILLDPTPWGIRMGIVFGHFKRRYVPNVWSDREATRVLRAFGLTCIARRKFMILPVDFPGRSPLESLVQVAGLSGLFLQQAFLARAESDEQHA